MSNSSATKTWWKQHWKLVVNLATVLALVVLVYAIRGQLANTFSNLFKVRASALLLLVLVEFINYDAQARLYRSLFRIVGNNYDYWSMFRTSLELNFVNHVFPSGGVSGISYFGARMRSNDEEMSASKATLVQLIKLGLLFLSFELLLIMGIVILAYADKVNNFTLLLAGSLSTLLLVGTILFMFIIGSKQRINMFFTAVTRLLNRLIHIVRPRHPETINISKARGAFDELHENYQKIVTHARELKGPFWYAFIANLTEVMAVYVVYIAFSEWVNLGAVILAYAVANFAGLVSILPGGVGVYEALMTAVLVAAGVPAGVSIPVTVMYRVLNTLMQLPPGYYFYHKTLKGR